MNKSFEAYLNQIMKNIDASDAMKRELYEELLDHLEQLRRSYISEGLHEEHAIKLAIADFGNSELIGGMINKTVSPNYKWLKTITWIIFTAYTMLVVHLLFLTQTRFAFRGMEHFPFPNLTPFHTILQYANGYHNYNFDTWFFNLFGNVLLFVPLGFLLPILIIKARGFFTIIISTLLVSLTIELTQIGTRLGSFDVDDLILNTLGGAIGYIVWKLATASWRLLVNYQEASKKTPAEE